MYSDELKKPVHSWAGWWDAVAYKLFQKPIKESDHVVHRSSEIFGDIMDIAIAGIQVSGAIRIAHLPRQQSKNHPQG